MLGVNGVKVQKPVVKGVKINLGREQKRPSQNQIARIVTYGRANVSMGQIAELIRALSSSPHVNGD